MRTTYDTEVDRPYTRFIETILTAEHVAEGIAADGVIAGIEILDARRRFGDPEVFRRVVLEDIALAKPAPATQS